jgi:alpha-tubulin suppressor-like RCC1 family protein
MIIQVSLGALHSSALTSNGRVFTWGAYNFGQLGDGTSESKRVPTDITSRLLLIPGETIIRVISGGYKSAVLSSNGRILVWGRNAYTGDDPLPIDRTFKFGLHVNETIMQVSFGLGDHYSALTSEGRLFTWGWNIYGQLGDNTTVDKRDPNNVTNYFSLNPGETITQVSLGGYFSSALTSEGHLLTWGNNDVGQLGVGTTNNEMTPTKPVFGYSKLIRIDRNNFNDTIVPFSPVHEGSLFLGWYSDQLLMDKFELMNMPAKSIVLYGKFISEG